MAEIAIVYFSMKGETIAPGMKIVNLKKGHTAVAAEYIQEAVGGKLLQEDHPLCNKRRKRIREESGGSGKVLPRSRDRRGLRISGT